MSDNTSILLALGLICAFFAFGIDRCTKNDSDTRQHELEQLKACTKDGRDWISGNCVSRDWHGTVIK